MAHSSTDTAHAAFGPRLTFLLDLIEGLWSAQALKERHFNHWFSELKRIQIQDVSNTTRLLLFGPALTISLCVVSCLQERLFHETSKHAPLQLEDFHNFQRVQMAVVNAVTNGTLYQLLLEQELALVAAGFPRFSPQSFVTIKTSYDSAEAKNIILAQKRLVCGLLLLRFDFTKGNHQDYNLFYPAAPAADLTSFYSAEAKTGRRKRRMSGSSNASTPRPGGGGQA